MLELVIMRILFGIALSVLLSIIVYHLFIVVKHFEAFKFSLKNNGLNLPLIPFVGNVYVALFAEGKANALSLLLWIDKHCGLPANLWYGTKYHYISSNAEEVRIILNNPECYNKADWYDKTHQVLTNSILTAPTEIWKPRRRYLRTAFKPSMIKNFYPTFNHQSDLLNKKIDSLTPTEDLFEFFNKYVFMNFFLTASGAGIESTDPNIERFGELLDRTQDEFVKSFINPLVPLSVWLMTPFGAKLKYFIEELETILNGIITNKRKSHAKTPSVGGDPNGVYLIDLLASEAYEKVGENVIRESIFLAAAATDTSGHTLAFCFTLLGMYPEVQQRAYEEVVETMGDSTIIDSGNIHQLKYIEAVICETLRLFPVIPLYGRRCDEAIDLGTKVIPKGANFVVSAFHLHRSPKYWEDPLSYDPTRFLPENVSKIVPGSYLPFSTGARNCLGKSMAMALLKITVAKVLRVYRITSRHKTFKDFKLESCLSMKTSHRLDCSFISRT